MARPQSISRRISSMPMPKMLARASVPFAAHYARAKAARLCHCRWFDRVPRRPLTISVDNEKFRADCSSSHTSYVTKSQISIIKRRINRDVSFIRFSTVGTEARYRYHMLRRRIELPLNNEQRPKLSNDIIGITPCSRQATSNGVARFGGGLTSKWREVMAVRSIDKCLDYVAYSRE